MDRLKSSRIRQNPAFTHTRRASDPHRRQRSRRLLKSGGRRRGEGERGRSAEAAQHVNNTGKFASNAEAGSRHSSPECRRGAWSIPPLAPAFPASEGPSAQFPRGRGERNRRRSHAEERREGGSGGGREGGSGGRRRRRLKAARAGGEDGFPAAG